MSKLWTVSQVAGLAHVTVRTLHHYDEIGLLVPARRSAAGYRLYGRPELERLHQILLFRELGFTLDAIGRLLDQPAVDRRSALGAQRELLHEKRRRTEAVIRAIDAALRAMEEGSAMDATELFDGFEDFDHARYADEARERWEDTDAYRESMRRTRSYGKRDWAEMRAEADAIMEDWVAVLGSADAPASEAAMELAERHRRHIDRWFYPCGPAIHAGLADLYEADPRFGEYFEKRGAGLASFVAAAIRANASGGA